MTTLTKASIRKLMIKTFGERLGSMPTDDADTDYDVLQTMIADKLAEMTEPLVAEVLEAAGEFARSEVELLLNDVYLLLDIYESDELTLKIMNDQNGEAVDFDKPIITLYDLILRNSDGYTDDTDTFYPKKSEVDKFIYALQELVTKLKNTKSWTGTSWDRPDDEPVPLTMNEREAGTIIASLDDGRIEKPRGTPYYTVDIFNSDDPEMVYKMTYKSRAHAVAAFHAKVMEEEAFDDMISLKYESRGVPEIVLAIKPDGTTDVTLYRSYYLMDPQQG